MIFTCPVCEISAHSIESLVQHLLESECLPPCPPWSSNWRQCWCRKKGSYTASTYSHADRFQAHLAEAGGVEAHYMDVLMGVGKQ